MRDRYKDDPLFPASLCPTSIAPFLAMGQNLPSVAPFQVGVMFGDELVRDPKEDVSGYLSKCVVDKETNEINCKVAVQACLIPQRQVHHKIIRFLRDR